jgi:hypothetical protein
MAQFFLGPIRLQSSRCLVGRPIQTFGDPPPVIALLIGRAIQTFDDPPPVIALLIGSRDSDLRRSASSHRAA